MQSKPRLLVNLLAKLTRKNPSGCMGAMGGAYPLPSLLAGCILAPPTKSRTRSSLWVPWEPTQFHGNHGPGPREGLVCWSGAVSMNAQGPWPPAGGGNALARGLAYGGVGVSPLTCSLRMVPPQDGPPIYRGFSVGLSITDFYRFFGLSWET